MDAHAADLCEQGALQRVLEARAPVGRVAVALACGAHVATAQAGSDAPWAAPIGCLAKLLTATLALRAAERGCFALDTDVATLLDAGAGALRGVTLRHLLEHTHGLDDSLLAAPRLRRGCVDRGELVARVARLQRFSPAGAAYSYGHAGAWLACAVLERVHGQPLAQLVRDALLAPLGVADAWLGTGAPLCAATGSGLALTAAELVRFGSSALRDRAPAPVTPLPGWHPLERGVWLGWKHAGAGWFGHQSVWPGASSYLRVQPQRELALAVLAREQPAALVAIGLFGARFPELFERRAQLPAASRDLEHAAGVYAQAARVVALEPAPGGLGAAVWARDERGMLLGDPVRAKLVPTRGVLFAQPATQWLPYAELVGGAAGAPWLWNGRTLLRRMPRDQSLTRR